MAFDFAMDESRLMAGFWLVTRDISLNLEKFWFDIRVEGGKLGELDYLKFY